MGQNTDDEAVVPDHEKRNVAGGEAPDIDLEPLSGSISNEPSTSPTEVRNLDFPRRCLGMVRARSEDPVDEMRLMACARYGALYSLCLRTAWAGGGGMWQIE